jgi:hypothetical protein
MPPTDDEARNQYHRKLAAAARRMSYQQMAIAPGALVGTMHKEPDSIFWQALERVIKVCGVRLE